MRIKEHSKRIKTGKNPALTGLVWNMEKTMSENCPVCQTVLENKINANSANSFAYECYRCGKFILSYHTKACLRRTYIDAQARGEKEEIIAILSHAIRKKQKDDSWATLDGNLIEAILKQSLPTLAEQKDIFIRWIGKNIRGGGDYVRVNKYSILAIIGARKVEEFYFIFEHLKTKGIVKNKTVVGGGGSALMDVTLSYDGWEYYNEIKGGDADKQKTFMEMESGPKEQIDEIHDNSRSTTMQWDIFICHASEDKKNFVEPLANALKEAGITVWYDRFELKIGDSLRGKIDEGLANSRYGVVVLSNSFFKKDWPKTELDALVSLENQKGEKVILPIWHGIGIEEVGKFSPILASKLAAQSSDSLESIVDQIKNVLNEKPTPATSTEELLTDPDDIINSLHYWLNEHTAFLRQKKETRWYFNLIDNHLKLAPGSAKKYLTEAINNSIRKFHIEIVNEGEKTILVRYYNPPRHGRDNLGPMSV